MIKPSFHKYIISIFTLLLLRVIDLLITYKYTPHLSEEWNPIVAFFGAGWTGMLITQVLIVGLIAFLSYFYFISQPLQGLAKDLSFYDYIYMFYFEKKSHNLKEMIQNKPRKGKHILAHNGFVLLFVAIFFSAFAIINNLLVFCHVYNYILFITRYGNYFYPILIAIFFLITFYVYFALEYAGYKKNQ